jgi:hypothetical protein
MVTYIGKGVVNNYRGYCITPQREAVSSASYSWAISLMRPCLTGVHGNGKEFVLLGVHRTLVSGLKVWICNEIEERSRKVRVLLVWN